MTSPFGLYPTGRAVFLAAIGAPVALLLGVILPATWMLAFGWPILLVALILADALLVAPALSVHAAVSAPATMPVGGVGEVCAEIQAPTMRVAECAIDLDAHLQSMAPIRQTLVVARGKGSVVWPMAAVRRGAARISALWVRWRGPLGLVWRQRHDALYRDILVLPNLRPVSEQAPLLLRRAAAGELAREARGLGTEFHALVTFAEGMDQRWIDWKQSARHAALLARDWRTEQNHQIVLALDTGRAMVEPVGGVPRIDLAVSAALLAAYVALKLGDRVGLYAYAERPLAFSGILSHVGAFAELQRDAARIDYTKAETNHVLGLTRLAQQLNRRSLIIVFTELIDSTSAEHLLRATATLLSRHVLLFVVGQDTELDQAIGKRPEAAEDVSRAVAAAALARERQLVLARLRHLGAHIVETRSDVAGSALVDAYLELKRSGLA